MFWRKITEKVLTNWETNVYNKNIKLTKKETGLVTR